MKPDKVWRHAFQCIYCSKKRMSDRPMAYREWVEHIGPQERPVHLGFYHLACRRAIDLRYLLEGHRR